MPNMRWDHASDQQLLACVIQALEPVVDWDKIAAEWPADAPIRPTPRAIREHVAKIREQLKAAGPGGQVGGASETGAKRKGRSAKAVTSPEKRSRTALRAGSPKSMRSLFLKQGDKTEEDHQAEDQHQTEEEHQTEEGEA